MVYLDETWCNSHNEKDEAWLETDKICHGGTIGGPVGSGSFELYSVLTKVCDVHSKPSGKGEHLIVLHAGGKDGWIPG